MVDPRAAHIERLKGQVTELEDRVAKRDEAMAELTACKTAALRSLEGRRPGRAVGPPMDHLIQRRTLPLRARLRSARRGRGSRLAEPGADPAVRLKQDSPDSTKLGAAQGDHERPHLLSVSSCRRPPQVRNVRRGGHGRIRPHQAGYGGSVRGAAVSDCGGPPLRRHVGAAKRPVRLHRRRALRLPRSPDRRCCRIRPSRPVPRRCPPR